MEPLKRAGDSLFFIFKNSLFGIEGEKEQDKKYRTEPGKK